MNTKPHVITLGTAGGPVWSSDGRRAGIATAIVVGDRTYLVDAGSGVGRQLRRAGREFDSLRAVFITHLHSDHIVDLAARANGPMDPVFPENPTPGISDTIDLQLRGFATDLNDRRFDSLKPMPMDWFCAQEISIADSVGFHPNDNATPMMDPFPVFEDDAVRVSAMLVKHAPMAPAFGYRIETEGGVVAISGDTGPTPNMVRLAADADDERVYRDQNERDHARRGDQDRSRGRRTAARLAPLGAQSGGPGGLDGTSVGLRWSVHRA